MPRAPRLAPNAVTAAVLAIAGFALAPGRAVASCGDYVTVGLSPVVHPGEAAPIPEMPPGPCHGPDCTGRPAGPATPVTAPVADPTGPHDPAAGAGQVESPRSARGRVAAEPHPVPPSRLPDPIFHPPR